MNHSYKPLPIAEGILAKLRQKAEQLLRDESGSNTFSAKNLDALLHELNVYHVELELQNEELRKTQEDLEHSRRHFFDLFVNAPIPYLALDEQGEVVDASQKAQEVFFNKHSLLRRRFRSHIPAEHFFAFSKAFKAAMVTEQRQQCEMELLDGNGERFWARLVMNALPSLLDGQDLVLCALVDLSEQKAAHQLQENLNDELALRVAAKTAELSKEIDERKQVEMKLRESEQLHKAVADNLPGGMVVLLERDLCVALARGSNLLGLGCKEKDLAGKNIHQLFSTNVAEVLEKAAGQALNNHADTCEVNLGERDFLVRSTPLLSADGNSTRALLLFQDITALKTVQNQLVLAKEAAESANKAKSVFLANMSHEIRTPISGVIGLTDLLLNKGARPEDTGTLHLIKKSAKDLLGIVSDILDLSRIEAGKLKLGEESFTLATLAGEVVALYKPLAEDKGLKLSLEIDPGLPQRLHGDPLRIAQVLRNVVSNAVKFTKTGLVLVRVRLKKMRAGKVLVQFSVQDTGPGIPAHRRPMLFQSFSQLDNSYSKNYGGAGLGLSISRELCGLMGGELWYEEGASQGSIFHFTLPLTPELAPKEDAQTLKREQSAPGKPLKVLLAEDNSVNQLFVSHFLAEAGHEVVHAKNGLEVLEALRKHRVDIVLMDVQMPEMDGIDATRRIRSDTTGKIDSRVPIIALTAYAMENDKEHFLAAGMNASVAKPVDFEELFRVMAEFTEREPA